MTFRSWDDSLVFICPSHRGGGGRGAALTDLAQISSSGNPLIRTSTDPTEGNHSVGTPPWDDTRDRQEEREGDGEGDRTALCGRSRSYETTSVAEAGLRRRHVDLGPPKATCQPSGEPGTSPTLWGSGDRSNPLGTRGPVQPSGDGSSGVQP